MDMITTFHFMRPVWFYALLPLIILLWLMWRKRLASRSWQNVIDPRLLPHLLIGESAKQRPWMLLLLALGGALAILALAGPAWKKLEVPVFRQPSALVVLLDLSRSMDATDIKPSRLLRAQMKLHDILNQRREGETALIVFAATPFVVSPLTPDAKTIDNQINSLSTDLMPAQGSRPDRAIQLAQQLLQQSAASHGGVLLISDGFAGEEPDELKAAVKELVNAGHRLSVLGVGSAEGAPIAATNGGFLKDRNGAIILPKLDDGSLQALARAGQGSYRRLSTDDGDLRAVLAPFEHVLAQQESKKAEGMNSDQWRDEGVWLLLPLLLLGAFSFRRGYVLVLLLLALPLPRPAYALDWNSLWQRDDQRAQQALQAQQPQQAAQLFKNSEWRAAANYRAGNYQAAAQDLQSVDSAEADYNRGNALAQQGHLQEAISAYDAALKRDAQHEDAKFNRDLVEQMLKNQPQSEQQKNQQQQDKNGDGNDQQKKSDDKNGSGQQQSSDKSEKQDGKESQQADAKDQGESKNGKGTGKSDSQKSGKDAPENKDAPGKDITNEKEQAAKRGAEQREKDQQAAMAQNDNGDKKGEPSAAVDALDNASELKQADKQWLRRIPDDPGGLWRRKFLYQYKQQQQTRNNEDKTW